MEESKCWIAQMKPFDPKFRTDVEVEEFQTKSINSGVCGMGWDLKEYYPEGDLSANENKDKYKAAYWEQFSAATDKAAFAVALNQYAIIRPDDYILTKLFATSVCYIGKVTKAAYYDVKKTYATKNGSYSWVVNVDWKYHEAFLNIPDTLRGIMQKRMNTIQEIKHEPQCRVVRALYGEKVEPFKLTISNFHLVLDSNSLEDLVAFYIMETHKGFRLLPSSCKATEPIFEFLLVNGDKKITCQVKNNRIIDVSRYTDDSFKKFDLIYLFSGLGYEKESAALSNVQLIPREGLYRYLKTCYSNKDHFYYILKDYYVFKD